jgi:hypothetical protein
MFSILSPLHRLLELYLDEQPFVAFLPRKAALRGKVECVVANL